VGVDSWEERVYNPAGEKSKKGDARCRGFRFVPIWKRLQLVFHTGPRACRAKYGAGDEWELW